MAALVIGAASFVGRHLTARLRAADIPFVGTGRTPKAGELPCDLTSSGHVERVITTVQPQYIFQCAGETNHTNTDALFRLHETATADLLRAVARHSPEAVVILFGSAAEYGIIPDAELPVREETPPRPGSLYGQSKLAQYQTACRLAREYGLRVQIVRPFNLLGPGLGPQYFVPSLIARLRRAIQTNSLDPIPISNGHVTRDWVDVRDLADAVVRLAFAPLALGEVGLFNVATGQETPLLTVASHLCRLAGNFQLVGGNDAPSRTGIDRSCGDSRRLRAWTGWAPQINWQKSLEDMWAGV